MCGSSINARAAVCHTVSWVKKEKESEWLFVLGGRSAGNERVTLSTIGSIRS